jgi:hypothetical protein
MELNRKAIFAVSIAFFFAIGLSAARADTYVVTSTNPSGPGSLAQAILDSNGHAGQDTIVFNIPGAGVHLIDLAHSSLPEITDSVIVDGYTQPGAHPNTLSVGNNAVILIQLDGGLIKNNGRGLVISGSNCLVRGLSLTGFQFDPSSDPIFFRVLGGFGIHLRGAGTGNVIQGNFIGLKPDGLSSMANYTGVRVEAAQSTIGGNEPAARNVISGNNSGIEIQRSGAVIVGNYLGTDASGTRAVGNGDGIAVAASDVVVGGTSAGTGNLISGNKGSGIHLGYEVAYHLLGHADRGVVQGNLIGTAADGAAPLGNGNDGVAVTISSNSTVGGLEPGAGNLIAFNGYGVGVGGTGNRILSNPIYSNAGHGIRFYSAYSNNGQSSPVITFANSFRGVTGIKGTLQSTANTEFLIQFFTDSQSLISSEQTYIGSKNVTTDSTGNAAFSATFALDAASPVFNATATDPSGNTSQFFRNVAYLQNISTRAAVGSGDSALIGGFIAGSGELVLRGIGPSLQAFGFDHVLTDPVLELHDQTGAQIQFNDNWQDNQYQAGEAQRFGLAPTQPAESAIVFVPFGRAPYTAVLRGKNDTGGVGLVEVYGPGVPLSNLSSRGLVGRDGNVLIGGFIVADGNANPRIVLRAIGPSLKTSGVAAPLADPMLELHDGNGLLISSNDDWPESQSDDLQAIGLAPADAAESAILIRLATGSYTAIVRGKNDTTGVALVEIYDLR